MALSFSVAFLVLVFVFFFLRNFYLIYNIGKFCFRVTLFLRGNFLIFTHLRAADVSGELRELFLW